LIFSYIGVITGVRPGIFSISMNERYGLKGGYIGLIEWIFNINRKQSFVTFAMRDMLTTSATYDQAVQYLAEVKLTAPCYYILAGPKAGQVSIFFQKNGDDYLYFVLIGCDCYTFT
jgi:acid ceramidase